MQQCSRLGFWWQDSTSWAGHVISWESPVLSSFFTCLPHTSWSVEPSLACCTVQVFIDKNEASKELLEWGSRVGAANGRKPCPT